MLAWTILPKAFAEALTKAISKTVSYQTLCFLQCLFKYLVPHQKCYQQLHDFLVYHVWIEQKGLVHWCDISPDLLGLITEYLYQETPKQFELCNLAT